jgi:hypothetical protein
MNKIVIKGAYYYDRESDTILIPHFTGEFCVVDCERYERLEALTERFEDAYIAKVKDYPTEFRGNNYYNGEPSPVNIGDWELLSDLSNLEYFENDFDF